MVPTIQNEVKNNDTISVTLVENNAEYEWFSCSTVLMVFWSLFAGLLLPDENKSIGFILFSFSYIIQNIYGSEGRGRGSLLVKEDIEIIDLPLFK